MVICLERGADLHVVQLMPLPLTVSCFSKIQIGFTFLVPAHPGSPGQRAVKRVRVCVCVGRAAEREWTERNAIQIDAPRVGNLWLRHWPSGAVAEMYSDPCGRACDCCPINLSRRVFLFTAQTNHRLALSPTRVSSRTPRSSRPPHLISVGRISIEICRSSSSSMTPAPQPPPCPHSLSLQSRVSIRPVQLPSPLFPPVRHRCRYNPGARFTKHLTTVLRLSYDNAKVTIDLRRTSSLQNILRRTQGCF